MCLRLRVAAAIVGCVLSVASTPAARGDCVTAFANGSARIRPGQSTAIGGSGGTTCEWSPALGLSDSHSCAPLASPSATTTYTLTVTDAAGCTSTNEAAVIVTVAGSTLTWTGASSSLFSDSANWSPAGVPQDGDALSFPASASNKTNTNDIAGLSVLSLTFNGGGYTLDGNAIGISGGITTGSSVFGTVLNLPVQVLADQTFGTSSGIVTMNGNVDVQAFTLTVEGGYDFEGGFSGSGTINTTPGGQAIGGTSTFSGTIVNGPCCNFLHFNGALIPSATVTSTGFVIGNGTIGALTTSEIVAPAPNDASVVPLNGSGVLNTGNWTTTGGNVYMDLQGLTPSTGTTGYDQINVTGTVTLAPSTELTLSFGDIQPAVGQVFVLINNDGSDPVNGTFNGKPDGTIITLGGVYQFRLDYDGGSSSNDVTLTCTAAPKVWSGAVSDLWSVGGNWVGGVAPSAGERIEFPASASNKTNTNDIAGLSLLSVTFNGGGYTIGGNTVGISGGITTGSSVFGVVLNLPVQLQASQTFSSGSGIVTMNGNVDVQTFTLTVEGGYDFEGGFSGSGTINTTLGGQAIGGTSTFSGTIVNGPCCNFLHLNGALMPSATVTSTGFVIGNGTIGALTTSEIVAPAPNDASVVPLNGSGVLNTGNWTTTGGNLYMDLQGLTPSTGTTGYDQINVTGTVTLAPTTELSLSFGQVTPVVGQVFVLINNDGSDPINGTFNGKPDGTIITLGGVYQFRLDYDGGSSSNDVTLTCTAAPKVWSGAISDLWSVGGNWVGGVVPAAGERIEFPASASNKTNTNDITGLSLLSVTFNGGGYTIGGNTVGISGGITTGSSVFGVVLNLPVQLQASQTFSSGSGIVTMNGNVDVQAFTLTVEGGYDFEGGFSGSGTINTRPGGQAIGGTSTFSGTIANGPCCNFLHLNGALIPSATVTSTGFIIGNGTIGALTTSEVVAPSPNNAPVTQLNGSGVLNTGNWTTTGGILYMDLQGPTPSTGTTGYDQMNVTGTVTLASSTQLNLSLSGTFVPTIGQVFVLINNDGADPVSGAFNAYPDESTIVVNGTQQFRIDYNGGTGNDVVLIALTGKQPTTTTLTSSANPSLHLQTVTFTATVTAGATGTVTFLDGSTLLGTVALSGNTAQLSVALAVGSHPITATYGGDSTYGDSTSTVLTQLVDPAAPIGLIATASSDSTVALSWQPVAGATSYDVYRTTSIAVSYGFAFSTTDTTANDIGLDADTTYLYQVHALGGGRTSEASVFDHATTVVFTDATLSGVQIKAEHLVQLRSAVNAMRTAANLNRIVFADTPSPDLLVLAVHLTDLRNYLHEALMGLGLPDVSYGEPDIISGTTTVKAAHFEELRAPVL